MLVSANHQLLENGDFACCSRQFLERRIVNWWARPCRHFERRTPSHLPGNLCQRNRCHQNGSDTRNRWSVIADGQTPPADLTVTTSLQPSQLGSHPECGDVNHRERVGGVLDSIAHQHHAWISVQWLRPFSNAARCFSANRAAKASWSRVRAIRSGRLPLWCCNT